MIQLPVYYGSGWPGLRNPGDKPCFGKGRELLSQTGSYTRIVVGEEGRDFGNPPESETPGRILQSGPRWAHLSYLNHIFNLGSKPLDYFKFIWELGARGLWNPRTLADLPNSGGSRPTWRLTPGFGISSFFLRVEVGNILRFKTFKVWLTKRNFFRENFPFWNTNSLKEVSKVKGPL